jgi:hypothetical protein
MSRYADYPHRLLAHLEALPSELFQRIVYESIRNRELVRDLPIRLVNCESPIAGL